MVIADRQPWRQVRVATAAHSFKLAKARLPSQFHFDHRLVGFALISSSLNGHCDCRISSETRPLLEASNYGRIRPGGLTFFLG